jgi:serine/threonine protein kinase
MAELILHDPDGWHPGEREVAEVLQRSLPDDWLLVAHLMVPAGHDDRELDLVVVGDGYVHNVEVKNSAGGIVLDNNTYRCGGGMTRSSPLRQAGTAAKVLRTALDRRIAAFRDLNIPVTSRVVFSNPDARLLHVEAGVRSRVSTLVTVATDLLSADRRSTQIAPLRDDLRRFFASARMRGQTPTDLQGFRVLERLDARRSCLTFRCQHFADDSVWTVRLLQPKATLDQEAADRELDALLTEYQALAALAPLGIAPRVEVPKRLETDQVLVAIEEPEGQSLLDLVEQERRPDEPEIRRVVHQAFRTLAMVHEQGHLHRAITPARVVLEPDGGVLLTDFQVAHIDGRTGLSAVLDELDPDDEDQRYWRAPETTMSVITAVEASDVYALATTLKAWVIGSIRSPDLKKHTLTRHPDARRRLGPTCDEFVEMLRDCRVDRYLDRPKAAEVADRWAPVEDTPAADPAPAQTPLPAVPLCHRELEDGDRIDDRFVFRSRLGAGATAVTVLAYDEQSEREVVLKGFDFDRVPTELAKQEFAALLELNHDRIAVVRDRYQPEHPYHLVIDLAPGSPAADRLDDFVGDAETVGEIALGLLDGLAYLHRRRMLHRDISAGNIVLGEADPAQLKIVDFGLATIEEQVAGSVGTPLYRAPEIEAGGEWTPACDTYSAGVLLYQLLTGELPYVVARGLVKAKPSELPTTLSREARRLAGLLSTATAFEPDDRFPDASEFLGAIEDLLTAPEPVDVVPDPEVQATAATDLDGGETPSDDGFDAAAWFDEQRVADEDEDDVDEEDRGEVWDDEDDDDPDGEADDGRVDDEVSDESGRMAIDVQALIDATMAKLQRQARQSISGAGFQPACEIVPYDGNAWLAPGRLRRYRVGLDRSVRAVVVRGGGEHLLVADDIPGLVEAVNVGKRAGHQSDGGSFVINEHGHVLVPTGGGVFCVGTLDGSPVFRQGDLVLTPEPDGLQPGDVWTGLLAGLRYRLKAGGDDIEYERLDGRLVRLSDVLGAAAARSMASEFARIKVGGGRLYVNEAGAVTSPMQRGQTWMDVLVGRIDPARWFPAPQVG